MSWRITWGDVSFTDDDLTVQDLCAVEQLHAAPGWHFFDVQRGPTYVAMIIVAYLARTTGRDVQELLAEVQAAKASTLMAALTVEG
jgi:hypothetical protein